MKKSKVFWTALVLVGVLICGFFVCGCGGTDRSGAVADGQETAAGAGRTSVADAQETAADEKLQIVTTIYPPYDFAQKVGGGLVEVTMLLKPGMESHSYEPTPADIIKIMHSDVFLYAGGESDVWVEELLSAEETDTSAYSLLEWVDPMEEEHVEGMQTKGHDHSHDDADDHSGGADHDDQHSHEAHDHADDVAYDENGQVCSEDHVHGEEEYHRGEEGDEDGDHDDGTEAVHLHEEEYDEHVWTSPQNAMLIVEQLRDIFSAMDPENAHVYTANAESYLQELEALDSAFWQVVNKAERKTLVFGDRFPLLYFVRNYGLDYYAAFPGCSMETEPSAATIAFLTDKVKEEEIPVIFYLELSNGKVAEAIAECTGAETACFYSGHAITADDLEAGEDYLSLMYRNVDTLKKALGE